MLAPAQLSSPPSPPSPLSQPDSFDALLATARMEALVLLRSLMQAIPGDGLTAAVIRERRLAATAILRIPTSAVPTPDRKPRTRPPAPPVPPAPPTLPEPLRADTSAVVNATSEVSSSMPVDRADSPPVPKPGANSRATSTAPPHVTPTSRAATKHAAARPVEPFIPNHANSAAARLSAIAGGTSSLHSAP